MAEKRMFARTIIDSDAFLDMPLSTQALYFHLAMRADDEGFINNPKKIIRMIGATDDEMKLLMAKKFVIAFESGVIVIKHWKLHNYIRTDRLKATVYQDERQQLIEKDNGSYKLNENYQNNGRQMAGKCQHRLDKISIDKISIDKDRELADANNAPKKKKPKPVKHKYGEFKTVLLSDDEYSKLINEFGESDTMARIERLDGYVGSTGKVYKDHYRTILVWAKKDKEQPKYQSKNGKEDFRNYEQHDLSAEELEELYEEV